MNAEMIAALDAARSLVETINASLETLEGKDRAAVALGLANLLNAMAKRIEG